jgi:hypothetical protein
MGAKTVSKKTKNAKPLPPIKVGDRVRHPDGTDGKVTGTDGSKVCIAWLNGETVTWEGSYLRTRGIQVIGDEPATEAPIMTTRTVGYTEHTSMPAPVETATPEPAPVEQDEPMPIEETPGEQPPVEPVATERTLAEQTPPVDQTAPDQVAPEQATVAKPTTAKKPRTRKASADAGKEKKLSAIDAAAKVLGEAGQPMTCPKMIDAMAAKQYWTSRAVIRQRPFFTAPYCARSTRKARNPNS